MQYACVKLKGFILILFNRIDEKIECANLRQFIRVFHIRYDDNNRISITTVSFDKKDANRFQFINKFI